MNAGDITAMARCNWSLHAHQSSEQSGKTRSAPAAARAMLEFSARVTHRECSRVSLLECRRLRGPEGGSQRRTRGLRAARILFPSA